MNATLFMSLEKHQIYLVVLENISFYISIPYKEFNKTNISIELRDDYNELSLSKNNLESIKSKLKDIYTKIDKYNITLVIPFTEDDDLNDVRVNENEITYSKLDTILGKVINCSYTKLIESEIEVANKIVIINNEKYKNFIKWFLNNYSDRCEYKSILELITLSNNDLSLNKFELTDINFVIGKEETEKPKEELNTLEVDPNIIIEEIDLPNNFVNKQEEKQLGYVSYCLLGIMSVIVSLVLLYILL